MLGLGFLLSAHAARIVVDTDGSGDHDTIQGAIDAASPGDHIAVMAGTYDSAAWSSNSVPIVGLGGPDAVWIETSDSWAVSHSDAGSLRVEGLSIRGATGGLYDSGGGVHARSVRAYDGSYGFYGYYSGDWLLEAVVAGGNSTYGVYAYNIDLSLEHATFVANGAHMASRYDSVSISQIVGYDGVPVNSCTSSAMDVSYALFGEISGTWPSCASSTSVMLGFDVEFEAYGDGDWDSTDLHELGLAVDAGPSGCEDVDGSVCDLGAFGGPWGSDSDEDSDGLPDTWEDDEGLDPSTDDGGDDEDSDGLDNLGEYLYGTDIWDADSDGDGAEDLDELQAGFDPLDGSDQDPTAAISAAAWATVGEVTPLDGSGSFDPLGQALGFRWTATTQPSASSIDPDLGSTPVLSFVPDAPGRWTIELEVDDGTTTDSVSVDIAAYDGDEIRIPEDFASFAEVEVQPGLVVVFGPGEHIVEGLSVSDELTLRGEGADETTLLVDRLTVTTGGVLRLQDLRVEGGSGVPVYAYAGRVELASVEVDAPDAPQAILVYYGVLTAWDLRAFGRDAAVTNTAGTTEIRRAHLEGDIALNSNSGRVRLEGVLLRGTISGIETRSDDLMVRHATFQDAANGIRSTSSAMSGDHLYFDDITTGVYCNGSEAGDFDFVMLHGSGIGERCTVLRSYSDLVGPDPDGVPAATSKAWDGGDWRRFDPDGTVTDIGVSGGEFGLMRDHGLSSPYEDADGDGLVAVTEWMLSTSDDALDSDADGHTDASEINSGTDPADPRDHQPSIEGLTWRTPVGSTLQFGPSWSDDPDGDTCALDWYDGSGPVRTADTSSAGIQTHTFTLSCGGGVTVDKVTLVVDEELHVPGDVATLAEAVLVAEDHHRIVLAAGEHVGDVDLRGLPIALSGEGRESRLVGDVWADQPELQLQDLWIDGEVRVDGGALSHLVVLGELWTGSAGGRYILVHDDVHVLDGASFRNLTVDGDGLMNTVGVGAAAFTGSLSANGDAILSYVLDADDLGERPFIDYDADPELAILEPWPQSPLWDGASPAVSDPDGSFEDVGYTGGPAAWPTDDDLDGMNDRWEALYGVDDPDADPDDDGLNNLEEFELGTSPANADTDGDRIPDGVDRDPTSDGGGGIVLRLDIDDRHPWPGQTVTLSSAGSYDPLGEDFAFHWVLDGPPGRIEADGPSLQVEVEVPGSWQVLLEVETSDGLHFELEDDFHARRVQRVAQGADLQLAVDEALPGTMLLLEEGTWATNLIVDKDLVIAHAEGSRGGVIEGLVEAAAVQVVDGHLLLEDITVRGAGGAVSIAVEGGDLELRRARIFAGDFALSVSGGDVDATNSVIIGADQLVSAYDARLSFRHSVLGYPEDEEVTEPPFDLSEADLRVENSAFVWTAAHINAIRCGFNCTADFTSTIVPDPNFLYVGGVATATDLVEEDPEFLLAADDAERLGLADFRVGGESPARDAASYGSDLDGSPADIGPHGGVYGDWPDVDEDRDGYTNLEGDCDDTDPAIVPDVWTGACPAAEGCAGCRTGAIPGLLATLLGLLFTRRRRLG